MTIHRPGLPGDLPPADVLWARWALVAVLEATSAKETDRYPSGAWIDDEGLHLDDGGCTWWTFSPLGGGRYVLYGEDESSGVKWHDTPIDMLAGGPDWLPYEELRDRLKGNELGCVYWYENAAWARAPYPDDLDDDGLDCGMSRFVERDGLLLLRLDSVGKGDGPTRAELLDAAEAGAVTPDLLERLGPRTDGEPRDLPAMLRACSMVEKCTLP
ncbi:hypothetical protein AB0C77_16935 [Streptomyces sp. NPDC048629]|uniref:hypothetical protein n=1 Tax=Streptomyces sp. NPDC048629 TaxID=3154824 RepID=UPI003441F124